MGQKNQHQTLTDTLKKKIYDAWHSLTGDKPSKAQFARKYGISPRSLGRIIADDSLKTAQDVDDKIEEIDAAVSSGEIDTTDDAYYSVPKTDDRVIDAPQYIVTPNSIVLVVDDEPITMTADNERFNDLKQAIMDQDWEMAIKFASPIIEIEELSKGRVTAKHGVIQFMGREVHNTLVTRILDDMKNGDAENAERHVVFLDNLMENPSYKSVQQLWGFLEHTDIPITDDGHFIAWKYVKDDYMDCHTGTIDNSVGKVVEMPRNEVEDDPKKTCSSGLHVCAKSYLDGFSGNKRVVACKIHPKDVVSVPTDYKNAKMRVCKYTVLQDVTKTLWADK